jgi:hypothetical protein
VGQQGALLGPIALGIAGIDVVGQAVLVVEVAAAVVAFGVDDPVEAAVGEM